MPREGVPYPSREICSLKCQIDALQRQINELMKSVNGVQGDGQGNVSLISGDPAIVINSDQVQHEIEISLDSSQLPAAAVSSVNSQTGAVQLEADDIPSDGNSDVQADIDALKALGVNLQGAINNEVTARGNTDAALQGNINTVQASIPGEAAQAVANDPTVQGLVTADAQNVKLGGSQNITGVKTVPTEATGSATQQIANGAKVKNELDNYAPMVRTTGNQNIGGVKKFTGSNVKVQGGLTFNNSDANLDKQRASVFCNTPTLYLRSFSQLLDNEFTELRVGCNRSETQITFGLYLLSYQNVNGAATLKDYHPIYEKVVTL